MTALIDAYADNAPAVVAMLADPLLAMAYPGPDAPVVLVLVLVQDDADHWRREVLDVDWDELPF